MDSNIQMPDMCAKCAENPPTEIYTYQYENISFSISPWTLLTMFFGFAVMKRKFTIYQIPICSECKHNFKATQDYWVRVGIACLVILTIGLLLLLSKTDAFNSVGLLVTVSAWVNSRPLEFIAGSLIFVSVLMMCVAAYRGAAGIVKKPWGRIKFYNKEFQKAFDDLNPNFGRGGDKRKKHPPLMSE